MSINLLLDKFADSYLADADEDFHPAPPDPYERAGLPHAVIQHDQTWVPLGACSGVNFDGEGIDFYDGSMKGVARAKAVCATCEVTSRCLEYALVTKQEWGVWGGMSEDERRILSKG